MSLEDVYFYFLLFWSSLAAVVFISLYFRDAPYGRFIDLNSSVSVSARTGWVVMESPTILGVIVFFIIFQESINLAEIVLSIIWLSHYLHRTLIWPFRAKLKGKQMSVLVIFMATLFNVVNVCLQFSWIFIFSNFIEDLLASTFFYIGLVIFYLGMFINIKSDNILMKLREVNGEGYHTPKGFLYKYVGCPNYFGELVEWLGWAVLTMSPSGFVFFIWTFANLVPRAKSNLEWSKSNIKNYPKTRKSIIPFVY